MHAFIIKSLSLHEKCKFSDLLFMAETIKTIKLSQIKVNAENPRTITGDKFQKLVNSILVFPKMMKIRPMLLTRNISYSVAICAPTRSTSLRIRKYQR